MFERELVGIERLLDNPVPQKPLGVGRWGPGGEVTTVKDLSTAPVGGDENATDLDADVSVDTE